MGLMLSGAGVPYLSAECGRDPIVMLTLNHDRALRYRFLAILDFVPETGIEAFVITVLPKCQKSLLQPPHRRSLDPAHEEGLSDNLPDHCRSGCRAGTPRTMWSACTLEGLRPNAGRSRMIRSGPRAAP